MNRLSPPLRNIIIQYAFEPHQLRRMINFQRGRLEEMIRCRYFTVCPTEHNKECILYDIFSDDTKTKEAYEIVVKRQTTKETTRKRGKKTIKSIIKIQNDADDIEDLVFCANLFDCYVGQAKPLGAAFQCLLEMDKNYTPEKLSIMTGKQLEDELIAMGRRLSKRYSKVGSCRKGYDSESCMVCFVCQRCADDEDSQHYNAICNTLYLNEIICDSCKWIML